MPTSNSSTLPSVVTALFWSKVDQGSGPDACWPWLGPRCASGRLILKDSKWLKTHSVPTGSPKLLMLLVTGRVDDPCGTRVHNTCSSSGCVNPDHLDALTDTENLACARAVSHENRRSRRRSVASEAQAPGFDTPVWARVAQWLTAEEASYLVSRMKVNRDTGCWEWMGQISRSGTPRFRLLHARGGTPGRLLYLAYSQGALGASIAVTRSCARLLCVNPEHHFARLSRTPKNTPALKRFVVKYRPSSVGCWEWTGRTNKDGYGKFYLGGVHVAAHRAAYELLGGPIPEGRVLDHLCCNPPCVNPEHLEPVTSAENLLRGMTRALQREIEGPVELAERLHFNDKIIDQFWSKVSKGVGEDCWLWTGSTSREGYGQFWAGGVPAGARKQWLAHRFAYFTLVGVVPQGYVLDHRCGSRSCVRPTHLDPVTPRENVRRSLLKRVAMERTA
jgi:hypothetical protein